MPLALSPLYPIIDLENLRLPLADFLKTLSSRGVVLVQLREKKASSRKIYQDAVTLVNAARCHGIRVIVNDRTDIALLSGAHGVHLGQEDLPVEEARRILGPDKILGFSTHNLQQALNAQESSADYVAIGPVFLTLSKENPDPVVSRQELQEIRRRVTKPLVAIGGITSENARELFEIGVDSVAVIREIMQAGNLADKLSEFLRAAQEGIS